MSEAQIKNETMFIEAFGHIITDIQMREHLENTKITKISYHKEKKRLEIGLLIHEPIDIDSFISVEEHLANHFLLETEIFPEVTRRLGTEQIANDHGSFILGLAMHKQQHIGDLLLNARMVGSNKNVLYVHVNTHCSSALQSAGTGRNIEKVIQHCFHRDLQVRFVEPQLHEIRYLAKKQEIEARSVAEEIEEVQDFSGQNFKNESFYEEISSGQEDQTSAYTNQAYTNQAGQSGFHVDRISSEKKLGTQGRDTEDTIRQNTGNQNQRVQSSGKQSSNKQSWNSGFQNNGNSGFGRRTSKKTEPGAIYGKIVKGRALPMIDVTADSGEVIVQGKVLKTELKELKSGRKIFTFDITDETSSISVKCFPDDERLEALTIGVKKDEGVKLCGEAQYDKYSDEMVIMMRDISPFQLSLVKRKDTAEVKRVELHLHTQMSSLDAISGVKTMIKRAASWGHRAVAITDHGVVQAFPDAQDIAEDLEKKDKTPIKILYGMECYFVPDAEEAKVDQHAIFKGDSYHAIVLVKNKAGLKNMYKMVSESHLDYFYKKPRVPGFLLEKYREGLIVGSACEAGEVFRAVLDKKNEDELIRIARKYDYLEIQPTGNNQFLLSEGMAETVEDLRNFNRVIVDLGEKLNIPVVATCDVHFLDPEDEVFRKILQAGQGYKDAEHQPPLYFRTTNEMLEEFAYLGRDKAYEVVVTNTNLVADWLDVIQPIPSGTFPPHMDGAEEDIRRMSEERVHEMYGETLPDIVNARVERELNSIIKNGFSVMYMIAQKLVHKSNEDGYLVGSRGSVGSSFVAYLIGITEVNSLPSHYRCPACKYAEFHNQDKSVGCGFDLPEKNCPLCGEPLVKDGYDIPFETFLGFDGDKEPDIDLNFSGEYQSRAHKYTEDLFGEGFVFRAGTISTIADKTAFGFVSKYFEEKGTIVTKAEKDRLASGCTGIKKTTGQHPGGVMIVPKNMEIYDFCPVQRPADATGSEIITTHFDYHSISGRILKLDILGHDDPTVIRMLEDLTGVNAQDIPIGEARTMEIFRSTEPLGVKPEEINSEVGTFGVPEFGTKFVRQMLLDTKPTTFAELIRISGLSHGTDVWLNNAQELVRAGTTSLPDVISTRDDIMIYLIQNQLPPLTSFKIMEGVRRGKGLKPEDEELMIKMNIPDWYIQSCKKIKYMFPKAHAAAYVMMAFRIAWFKVYKPKAFYTAYFSVRADGFDADIVSRGPENIARAMKEIESKGKGATAKELDTYTILEVAREMYARGIKCLPVDLIKSDSKQFIMTDEGILPPFNSLQGLGLAAADKIVEARKGDPFLSQEDLKIRAGISKAVIEIMEKHGCLGHLEETSQISLFSF